MADTKYKKSVFTYFKALEKDKKALAAEDREKKIQKLQKEIKDDIECLYYWIIKWVEDGGTIEEIARDASDDQRVLLEELFPGGLNAKGVAIQKEINGFKERIEKIKKYEEKDPYEEDWSMDKKRKSKHHKEQRYLYFNLRDHSDPNENEYIDVWNYVRDYESTKDIYFTAEEQAEIKEACRVGMEEREWFAKEYPERVAQAEKIGEIAKAIGDWGELTQAKMDAKNLAEEVFPFVVEQIKGPHISKKEKMEEGRQMARRFIDYRRDPEREMRAIQLVRDAMAKAEIMRNDMVNPIVKEGEKLKGISGLIINSMIDNIEEEMQQDAIIEGLALSILQKEYGAEEAFFMLILNHEEGDGKKAWYKATRAERTGWLTKYSFEELGI